MDLSKDVRFGDNQDNMAGVTKRAYIGFEFDFLTLATPIAVPVEYADRVTIATAHVLKPTKKIVELFIMYDKSEIESPLVGQRKGKSHKPKFKLFYPGTDAEVTGFYDFIKNADLILFAEPPEGDYLYQVGNKKLPASLVAGTWKTGAGPEGENGVNFEVEAPSSRPIYFYTAALPRVGAAN